MVVYPSNMALIGVKLWENRFRRSLTFEFSTPKTFEKSIFWKTLNGRLPPEDGSDLAETWPKCVSDDPRHFIFLRPTRKQKMFFYELWPVVYPRNMAPIGFKLWENAFQMMPDISFFDVEKKIAKTFD